MSKFPSQDYEGTKMRARLQDTHAHKICQINIFLYLFITFPLLNERNYFTKKKTKTEGFLNTVRKLRLLCGVENSYQDWVNYELHVETFLKDPSVFQKEFKAWNLQCPHTSKVRGLCS
jgi:hypothetical protein